MLSSQTCWALWNKEAGLDVQMLVRHGTVLTLLSEAEGCHAACACMNRFRAPAAEPVQPEQAIQAASASPVAMEAWCTVTDRLRRLRADLEVILIT